MVVPASGAIARLASSQVELEPIQVGSALIPVVKTVMGGIIGLPAPAEGVVYLVGAMVADAACRADVVGPRTDATAIRKDGQVWAVRGLQAF